MSTFGIIKICSAATLLNHENFDETANNTPVDGITNFNYSATNSYTTSGESYSAPNSAWFNTDTFTGAIEDQIRWDFATTGTGVGEIDNWVYQSSFNSEAYEIINVGTQPYGYGFDYDKSTHDWWFWYGSAIWNHSIDVSAAGTNIWQFVQIKWDVPDQKIEGIINGVSTGWLTTDFTFIAPLNTRIGGYGYNYGTGSNFYYDNFDYYDDAAATLATTSNPVNLTLGTPICCGGQECDVPITFGQEMDNTTISWGLDLNQPCSIMATFPHSTTANFYSTEPENLIASTSISTGNHTLCVAWNNGTDGAVLIKNFNTLSATSTMCEAINSYLTQQQRDAWCLRTTICAGIASSSPGSWYNFAGAAECSGRMIGCWLFVPQKGVISYVTNAQNQIMSVPPVNIITALGSNFLKLGADNYATSTAGYPLFVIPANKIASTSTTTISLFNTAPIQTAFGTKWIWFRQFLDWSVWLGYVGYLFQGFQSML